MGETITSWACLLEFGLKHIFYWKPNYLSYSNISFNFFADNCYSCIIEKGIMVLSAKNWSLDTKFSRKFIKQIIRSSINCEILCICGCDKINSIVKNGIDKDKCRNVFQKLFCYWPAYRYIYIYTEREKIY